jgi:hypothetical protein
MDGWSAPSAERPRTPSAGRATSHSVQTLSRSFSGKIAPRQSFFVGTFSEPRIHFFQRKFNALQQHSDPAWRWRPGGSWPTPARLAVRCGWVGRWGWLVERTMDGSEEVKRPPGVSRGSRSRRARWDWGGAGRRRQSSRRCLFPREREGTWQAQSSGE